MYDFHKIRNENNETEFRHRLFQRGNKYEFIHPFQRRDQFVQLFVISRNMLIEIKRKSGENGSDDVSEQGQMSAIDQMEMERIKKDYSVFLSEVMNMKQKYTELERIIHQIAASIEKLYADKNTQDRDFQKFKEEQEQKGDKFYYILSYLLTSVGSQENNSNNYSFMNDTNALSSLSKKCQSNQNPFSGQQGYNKSRIGSQFNQFSGHNNPNNQSENEYGHTQQGLNSSCHSRMIIYLYFQIKNILGILKLVGENESSSHNNNNTNNHNSHNTNINTIAASNNNNQEHRISKKQDWGAVHQLKKDGDTIPVCPLPFVQKKKEKNIISQKKIINLVNTFKNADLINIQKPEIFDNVLRDIISNKTMTVSEEAVNQYTLGSQAKRMFSGMGNTNSNQNRQNIQLFENLPIKRFCSTSGGNLNNNSSGNSHNINIFQTQLGLPSIDEKGSNIFSNLNSDNSTKQISLQLQHSFNTNNNTPHMQGNNAQGANLFNSSYFNGGESSPRLGFNIFPSPTPNNQGSISGTHSGMQNFLASPSPDMSPLLLRDMEEFIREQNINSYPMTSYQNTQNNTQNNTNNSSNNVENNRRIANDLLTSFKVEPKTEHKFY